MKPHRSIAFLRRSRREATLARVQAAQAVAERRSSELLDRLLATRHRPVLDYVI